MAAISGKSHRDLIARRSPSAGNASSNGNEIAGLPDILPPHVARSVTQARQSWPIARSSKLS